MKSIRSVCFALDLALALHVSFPEPVISEILRITSNNGPQASVRVKKPLVATALIGFRELNQWTERYRTSTKDRCFTRFALVTITVAVAFWRTWPPKDMLVLLVWVLSFQHTCQKEDVRILQMLPFSRCSKGEDRDTTSARRRQCLRASLTPWRANGDLRELHGSG